MNPQLSQNLNFYRGIFNPPTPKPAPAQGPGQSGFRYVFDTPMPNPATLASSLAGTRSAAA